MANKKLTPKQDMFVKEYLIDLNATQAAIRSGYSQRTAAEQASRLLTNVNITDAIQRRMDKRSEKVAITAEDVLNDILDTRDSLKRIMTYKDAEGHEMVELTAVNGRLKANEMLGKHLKLFTDKVELEVTKMPDVIIGKSE